MIREGDLVRVINNVFGEDAGTVFQARFKRGYNVPYPVYKDDTTPYRLSEVELVEQSDEA